LPSQAILLAGSADDALGVLVHVVSLALLVRVVVLRFYVALADFNGVQFIGADAAIEEFLAAGFGVKVLFVTPLYNRHGERPVFVTHEEECAVPILRIHGNAFLFVGLGSKISGVLPVLRQLAAEYDVLAIGPKNLNERSLVELLGRGH
jgi:hypothetical protein